MTIKKIYLVNGINSKIYNKLKQRIQMFVEDKSNPLLLAVHKLYGKLSDKKAFFVTGNIRVVFVEMENSSNSIDIIFEAVGPHPKIYCFFHLRYWGMFGNMFCMPVIKSAKKALRASNKKKVFNDRRKKTMKEAVKATKTLIKDKKAEDARASLSVAYKAIDKAVKRGVIKKNTAARKKSRLVRMIKKSA